MEHLKKITMVRRKTCCSGGQYLIRPSSCPSSATIFSTTISLSVLDEYLDGNKAGKSHQSQGRGCALHCSGRLDPHQAEQGCGRSFHVLPAHSKALEKHLKAAGKVREELWLSLCPHTAPPGNGGNTDLCTEDSTLMPSDSLFVK